MSGSLTNRETSPKRNVLLSPSVTLATLNATLPAEQAIAGVTVAVLIVRGGRVGGGGVAPGESDVLVAAPIGRVRILDVGDVARRLLGERGVRRADEGVHLRPLDRDVGDGDEDPAEVVRVEDRGRLDVRQHEGEGGVKEGIGREVRPARREDVALVPHREDGGRRLVVVGAQGELLEVVGALGAAGGPRAACTAGSSSAISTAMMAMTTRSSISVKPGLGRRFANIGIISGDSSGRSIPFP